MKITTFIALLLTLGLQTAVSANDHGSQTYASPFSTGEIVENLAIPTASDATVDLSGRTIIVRYLGYTCSHCVEQLSYLNRNAKALKRYGIRVVAFSDDSEERNEQLMQRMGYDAEVFTILSDPDQKLAKRLGAVRTENNEHLDLHAAIVVVNNKIELGVYSSEPYMDVDRLVATALRGKKLSEEVQGLGDHTLDRYLSDGYTVTTLFGPADGIVGPVDLDFNESPLHPFDLWVVTTGNNGHGIALIHDAPFAHRSLKLKRDSRASHFMWRTMGIAMGPDGSFATAQNGEPGGMSPFYQFMGPTLWSSDTAIFAQRNQNSNRLLGSHLDMLHQNPMNLGIAHETANVYWLSDGYRGNVARYDFSDPHEFGGHDHRDGIIRQYPEATVANGERGRPAHLAFDANKQWLYFIDPDANELKRLDISTGGFNESLTPPNESRENLAEYSEYTQATVEVVVGEGLGEPTGIAISGNRLFVGDRISGDIHVFDLSTTPISKLGSIATGAQELLGIEVGPDERIYFVDRELATINRIETSTDHSITADADVVAINSNEMVSFTYVNASSEQRTVDFTVTLYPSTPEGEFEGILMPEAIRAIVDGNQSIGVRFPVELPDTLHAFRIEIVEDNGTELGGVRAHTMVVPAGAKRVVVEDAMTEKTRITPAMAQTDRQGYVPLRADLFLRIAHELSQLETVVWNAGSMSEISITDDAVLNALMDRDIEVMLIADDPFIQRTDLPMSSQFFARFGARIRGAEVRQSDNGQRVYEGVEGDPISDGMTLIDCQLPRLDHDRGGDYVPNVLFQTISDSAASFFVRVNTNQIDASGIRLQEGFRRSVILGINIERFEDGFQRTVLLDKSVAWLEAAPRESIKDTTTSVNDLAGTLGISMSLLGNPATDASTLLLEGNAESITIGLYTVSGQKLATVFEGALNDQLQLPVDISSYARGTMFVIAHTTRGTLVSTLVKQ